MSGEATKIDARPEGVAHDARQRRALEGWLVGRIRKQARQRRAQGVSRSDAVWTHA
jgi:hypothetical protein